jgi:alpha-tubulin suppressor-like RCC1 family protein
MFRLVLGWKHQEESNRMNVSKLFFLLSFIAAILTCTSPQNPFTQDKAKVFLHLESSTKTASDSAITDTAGNIISIGISYFMSQYFDSVIITVNKSIQEMDTFFVCKKSDIKDDTAWFEYAFKSEGIRIVTATGYVGGGYKPTETATITVIARPVVSVNHKPHLVITGGKDLYVNAACSLFVAVSDSDTLQTDSTAVIKAPAGYTFQNNVFRWTPTISSIGKDTVFFVAIDNGVPVLTDTQIVILSVLKPAPAKPLNLRLIDSGATFVKIITNSVLFADSFFIYRSAIRISPNYKIVGKVVDTTFTDTGLNADSAYSYYLVAKNSTGISPSSDTVSRGKIFSDTTPPTITFFNPPKDSTTINSPFISVQMAIKDLSGISRVRVSVGADTFAVSRSNDTLWNATVLNLKDSVYTRIVISAWDSSAKQNKDSVAFYVKYVPAGIWPKAIGQTISTKENVAIAITLSAAAETGKTVTGWAIIQQPKNGTLLGSGNSRTYTPTTGFAGQDTFTFSAAEGTTWGDTAKVTITVIPLTRFRLTINTNNGTVTPQPVGPDYDSGATVAVTATPNSGYRFASWTGDLTGDSAHTQLIMNSSKTITANYKRQYTLILAVSPANSGSVSGGGTNDSGASNAISCTAAASYQFIGWTITSGTATWTPGSSATTPSSSIKLSSNATLTANFMQLIAPTITQQPTALQTARIGDSVRLYVTATGNPLPKYQWYKNGSSLTGKTDSILLITGIQRSDSATYYVAVSNSVQSISSHDAVLNVRYAKAVYAGSSIFFVTNDGAVWGCGSNWMGQIGDGTTKNVLQPEQIMTDVASVSPGPYNTLFLKKDATLWGCGDNSFGQLGDTTTANYLVPTKVCNQTVISFCSGQNRTAYIPNSGMLWICGQNYNGDLGIGSLENSKTFVQVPTVSDLSTVNTGDGNSTFTLKNDRSLWAWGSNCYGQLGDSSLVDRLSPKQIMPNVSAVASGQWHTLILGSNGTVYGCGYDGFGQLAGLPDSTKIPTPIPNMTGIKAISALGMNSLFLKSDSTLWGCGGNQDGQLGDGNPTVNQPVPKKIGQSVTSFCCGASKSVFIKSDGTLWGCGMLGVGDSTTYNKPVLVPKRIF